MDISTDLQQRTLRQAQRYVAGKDINPNVFDDSQYQVFKELLPFWAGFIKKYETPDDEHKRPCMFSFVTLYSSFLLQIPKGLEGDIVFDSFIPFLCSFIYLLVS